jgi:hypothetical protein
MQQGGLTIEPSFSLEALIRDSLYTKRSEFEHEHEVRILRMDPTDVKPQKPFEVSFNPQTLFDEIVIDPRTTDDQYQKSKILLINAGADESNIRKSQLYTMNRFKIYI